jgi:xylulokinase
MVLPYFTPSGTPYFDLTTGAAILGLRLSTTRTEILRALLEGVAMEMRLNLEILAEAGCAVRELRLVGGGARSSRWNQLRADVLGRELQVTDTVEAGCAGAALLARTAATGESGLILAKRWARVIGIYRPDPERWEFYQDKFTCYRDVYPALAQLRI